MQVDTRTGIRPYGPECRGAIFENGGAGKSKGSAGGSGRYAGFRDLRRDGEFSKIAESPRETVRISKITEKQQNRKVSLHSFNEDDYENRPHRRVRRRDCDADNSLGSCGFLSCPQSIYRRGLLWRKRFSKFCLTRWPICRKLCMGNELHRWVRGSSLRILSSKWLNFH